MSSCGILALVVPETSYLPSSVGSETELKGVSPGMFTGELATNNPSPPFCRTYMPCGVLTSLILFESA